nr:piscidin-like protein 2 [Lateolabrax japonicus]
MKFVMIFLVLTLVVLMAEPGEGFLKSIWRAAKGAIRGAKSGWRAHRNRKMHRTDSRWDQGGQQQDYDQP